MRARDAVLALIFTPVVACSILTSLDDLKGSTDAGGDAGGDAVVPGCDAASCNGACVDLQGDPKHCGTCARACHAGDTCSMGVCQGDVVDIVSGGPTVLHTCAVLASGALYCWGNNADGELGLVDKNKRTQATHVATDNSGNKLAPVSVTMGASFTMLLDKAQRILATGDGTTYNQFDGYQAAFTKLTPIETNVPYSFLVSGTTYTCGGGDVGCWGVNGTGQLGHASGTNGDTPCPSSTSYDCNSNAVPTGIHALTVAVGGVAERGTTCALLSDGSMQCWGDGTIAETGTGQATNTNQPPTQVVGMGAGALATTGPSVRHSMCVNGFGACALKADGTVWCWGLRVLGTATPPDTCTNSTPCAKSPVQVQGISGATGVACGGSHACAVLSSGKVFCWGANDVGQLGVSDIAPHDGAVEVKNMQNAKIVTAGDEHVCVATTDGYAYCWGLNADGELGNADDAGTNSSTPVQVLGLP